MNINSINVGLTGENLLSIYNDFVSIKEIDIKKVEINDDIKIIKYLYKIDKPTLGICLGMQEMALSLNGQVCKLESNIHNQSSKYVHEIYFNKNSKLFEIIKNDKILVNSRHNYYVIKTNLLITAISNDNIIEALEDPNKKFFIGLQWHPESLKQDLNSQKIFDAFIKIL